MKLDLHPELLIQPHLNGVKLVKPHAHHDTTTSIKNIFSLPIQCYFVVNDSFIDANHLSRITLIPQNKGYYSDSDLKNKKYSTVFDRHTVEKLAAHNRYVFSVDRMTIFDEPATRLDDLNFEAVTFKFPLFDSSNSPVAIFGMSTFLDNSMFPEAETLIRALDIIIHTGLIPIHHSSLNTLLPGTSLANVCLSKQEVRCIRLLIAGKTSKLIGQSLHLSTRTVEHYLAKIKHKLNVKTKAELIEKVLKEIWPNILT